MAQYALMAAPAAKGENFCPKMYRSGSQNKLNLRANAYWTVRTRSREVANKKKNKNNERIHSGPRICRFSGKRVPVPFGHGVSSLAFTLNDVKIQ
jgi:hypothetical protein